MKLIREKKTRKKLKRNRWKIKSENKMPKVDQNNKPGKPPYESTLCGLHDRKNKSWKCQKKSEVFAETIGKRNKKPENWDTIRTTEWKYK